MGRILKSKKVGAVGAALALLLAMGGSAVSPKNVFADCEGPADLSELQALLDERESDLSITLCGDIDGQFTVYRRLTTIDLNGYTISSGENAFARVREQGQIKIVGTGNVNGRMSGGFNSTSFMVEGGTWSVDPSAFVSEPYAVYGEAGAYVVEPEITEENLVVSPAEESEGLFIHKGESGKIEATLPEGSTSGLSFVSDDESVVSVSEDGTVTGVEAGYTWVTVSPTYDESIAKEITVTVYEVAPTTEGDEGETGAAENLKGLINEAIEGTMDRDNEEVYEKLYTAFGGEEDDADATIENLQNAVYWGEVVNTTVNVDQASLTDDKRAEMVALMDGVSMDNVKFYDVTIDIESYGDRIGGLHEMDKAIRIYVAEVSDPEDGYSRQYYVVSRHGGEEPVLLTEGVDYEIKDGKFYLISNRFSVFALGFKDTLIPAVTVTTTTTVTAPETGAYTTSSSDGAEQDATSMVAVVAAISAIVMLAGAVKSAKRK